MLLSDKKRRRMKTAISKSGKRRITRSCGTELRKRKSRQAQTGLEGVCPYVDVGVLVTMCWCAGVSVCWFVGVSVCWCAGVLTFSREATKAIRNVY